MPQLRFFPSLLLSLGKKELHQQSINSLAINLIYSGNNKGKGGSTQFFISYTYYSSHGEPLVQQFAVSRLGRPEIRRYQRGQVSGQGLLSPVCPRRTIADIVLSRLQGILSGMTPSIKHEIEKRKEKKGNK